MSTKPKTYTLELTAEELEHIDWVRGRKFSTPEIACKLYDLQQQARQDRAADELRLPWRALLNSIGYNPPRWQVIGAGGLEVEGERSAKLRSAAPELLEAVQAVKSFMRVMNYGLSDDVGDLKVATPAGIVSIKGLVDRALRKVETGVPE